MLASVEKEKRRERERCATTREREAITLRDDVLFSSATWKLWVRLLPLTSLTVNSFAGKRTWFIIQVYGLIISSHWNPVDLPHKLITPMS
ncbi:hypothetical protein Nepgr_020983 [Nepenthes gracilis]|uniref:Uncharacterized protein n=1 Tax=Nepenthes gracilis TaxID=150966 RepID=A0AAD3SYZ7_NEPGR|nr:hypothetical protein Nepgr_020983 [Nepenthes gracilis]